MERSWPKFLGLGIPPIGGSFDAWSPMRTMRLMLELLDLVFLDYVMDKEGWEIRHPWNIREEDRKVRMRFDMPGLLKEDVRMSIEDGDELVIRGEHKEEEQGDNDEVVSTWSRRRRSSYETRLELLDDYSEGRIMAETKNGVIRIVIPKVQKDRKVVDVTEMDRKGKECFLLCLLV